MIIRQRPDIKWGDRLNMYIYGTKVTYHSDSHVGFRIRTIKLLENNQAFHC